ncbi:VgrG-related protein [Nonomuraea longicatena]|uniref:VgrG-related protein n=1 Tax=Nonomuraea longicatena TaxID=83682 RepID=A0ABP3Z797_9ACTN
MGTDLFTGGLMVEVEGAPLADDVAVRLAAGFVEDSGYLPDLFVLRFRDDAGVVLAKGGFVVGARVRLRVQTSDPGGPRPLMTGEVTSVALDVSPDGSFVEVRGMDEAHRLMRGRQVAIYPEMSVADIVRKIAHRAGLQPGDIDPLPGVGGASGTQLNQGGLSDWEFLSRLARTTGARVRVTDGRLSFRLARPPSGPAVTVAAGGALLSLHATVTSAGQVPEVEVRGWDYQNKQAISARTAPCATESQVAGADPVALGRRFAAPPLLAGDSTRRLPADVNATADALAACVGGAAAELDGVVRGDPRLRAGTAITLTDVGAPFEGTYTLSATRHSFSGATGYTTAFTVAPADPPTSPPNGTGLVPAIVSDIHDPAGQGRVRLSLPWLADDYTSGWARVVAAGAGSDRGAVLPSEVGDEVLVGFENGDFDQPYVLGGLFNGQDAPPGLSCSVIDDVTGKVNVRALVSRAGHRLELVDSVTDGGGVLLASGDGQVSVRLDARTGRIEVTGATGISIDAGAGPLELKGARVTVTGDADVEITGAQVRIN